MLNIQEIAGAPTFCGYPDSDHLFQVREGVARQIATIFERWQAKGEFPVKFVPDTHFDDQTPTIIQSLNLFTPELKALFALMATAST